VVYPDIYLVCGAMAGDNWRGIQFNCAFFSFDWTELEPYSLY